MRLLLTGSLGANSRQLAELGQLGHRCVVVDDDPAILECDVSAFDGVVCNNLLTPDNLGRFSRLRFVQFTSAGLDRAPVDRLIDRGAAFFGAGAAYAAPIAEWVVLRVLEFYKFSRWFDMNQDAQLWEKRRDLRELTGRSIVIVGFGAVGRQVASLMLAFGVTVIAVDPSTGADSTGRVRRVAPENLAEVLSLADVLVLSCPLNATTAGLIGARELSMMKPDSVIVNVARGGVIDQDALVGELGRGRFLGVALDVFDAEPLDPGSPLWRIDRVAVSPHVAFVSDQVQERLFQELLRNLSTQEAAGDTQ